MDNLTTAVNLLAQLNALRPLQAEQEKRIWQKFRLDWNFHSNNLEGNSLTFGETKSLLLHNITAQGKPLKDHIEITGHNEAINAILDATKGEMPITESFLRELHVLILKQRYQSNAMTSDGTPTRKWIEVGQYKQTPNHVITVTGESFHFAEPYEVPAKMQALVAEANLQKATPLEGLLLASKLHYEFVLVHPFDDGNGRMARILMNLILMRYGFPPAIVKTQEKEAYFSALRQADGGQFDVFADYIAAQVCSSLRMMLDGAAGKDISDSTDLDKEIALMNALLEQRNSRLNVSENIKTVEQVFEKQFLPLVQAISNQAKKFQKLYKSVITTINTAVLNEQQLSALLTGEATYFSIAEGSFNYLTEFFNLNFNSIETKSYQWSLSIILRDASFEIDIAGMPKLTKAYTDSLSALEIQTIVEHLTKFHMAHIKHVTGIEMPNT
jgi:Fic family protein